MSIFLRTCTLSWWTIILWFSLSSFLEGRRSNLACSPAWNYVLVSYNAWVFLPFVQRANQFLILCQATIKNRRFMVNPECLAFLLLPKELCSKRQTLWYRPGCEQNFCCLLMLYFSYLIIDWFVVRSKQNFGLKRKEWWIKIFHFQNLFMKKLFLLAQGLLLALAVFCRLGNTSSRAFLIVTFTCSSETTSPVLSRMFTAASFKS